MVIGIDISQVCYKGTGVGRYVEEIVKAILAQDRVNHYVLFASSLRQRQAYTDFFSSLPEEHKKNTVLKIFPFPPSFLDLLWNRLQIVPVELLIGDVDLFWSSDWTQPPLNKAIGVTTIHDLTPLRYPETFPKNVVEVHKRKLHRSKDLCRLFFCDSTATKQDAHDFLGIPIAAMHVVYPGYRVYEDRN